MALSQAAFSFINVLGEIANGLTAATSGACICWCLMSPINNLLEIGPEKPRRGSGQVMYVMYVCM